MRKNSLLYWLTVIPAIIDALRGAYIGVKKGLEDIKAEKVEKKEAEQKAAFDRANRGEEDF